MDVKELRLGNLIEYDGKVCEVKQIEEAGLVVLFEDGDCIWIDVWQFSPIAITEKWLLKFGTFKTVNKNTGIFEFKLQEDYRVCVYLNNKFDFQIDCGDYYRVLANIQYVHHLQNLYYCLTQKELTFI